MRIIDHIARESGPTRAESVLDDIVAAAAKLAAFPGMGHARDDLTDEPLRFWPVRGFLLVYRPETQPLEIIHIVSGQRDVEFLIGERGDG